MEIRRPIAYSYVGSGVGGGDYEEETVLFLLKEILFTTHVIRLHQIWHGRTAK